MNERWISALVCGWRELGIEMMNMYFDGYERVCVCACAEKGRGERSIIGGLTKG